MCSLAAMTRCACAACDMGSVRSMTAATCPLRHVGGHVHDKEPGLQLSATTPVRWVSKSRVIWLTLEEMPEPGEPARPPVRTKRDDS